MRAQNLEKLKKEKKKGKSRRYDTELLCSAPVVPGESLKTSITLSFHGWLPVHTNAAPRGRCQSTNVLPLGRKPLLKQVKSLLRHEAKGKVRSSPQPLFAFPQYFKVCRSHFKV